MATHTSAPTREQASDVTQTHHVNRTTRTATIINALKRRAQAVLNDESIDPHTRAIIRHGLETNDPWLVELVRRADAGDEFAETSHFSQTTDADEGRPNKQKVDVLDSKIDQLEPAIDQLEPRIGALAELICSAGDEYAGALFVLMGLLEHSTHPDVLANTAKHLAFTRCGEFNLFGMVDAQIAVVESELFAESRSVY